MSDLASKKCVPCEGGIPPLPKEEAKEKLSQVEGWEMADDGKSIKREFKFEDFKESMEFVNQVADIAEAEGHHPDMYIFYNKVRLELSTHAINGLHENDFILAAKINEL